MYKILLTGHKGFIGSNLKTKLESKGYDVTGMDLKNGRSEDIRSRDWCKNKIRKNRIDVVIHLAARAGVRNSEKEAEDYFKTNITGTYNLLSEANDYGVKKFLVASSSSVYGNHKNPLKEDMECNSQLSPYAVSKKSMEMVCKLFPKLPIIVFRPFTVYGDNSRKDMVVDILLTAARNNLVFEKFGTGEQKRGFTHVDDLCEGIIKLIDYNPKNNFEIFNLGGDKSYSLNDLIKIVKKYYPSLKEKEKPFNSNDVMETKADIKKIKRAIRWSPKKNILKEIEKLCLKEISVKK